jgi:hypothetical protein
MLCYVIYLFSSRDNAVYMFSPGYKLENPVFDSRKGQHIYFFWGVHAGSEVHAASYSMEPEGSSPAMRDRSMNLTTHLRVVIIKNEWSYASAPSIYLRAVRMDSFTFLLISLIKIEI